MTLHLYFGRRFFMSYLSIFSIFLGLALLFDFTENVRRFGGADTSLGAVFQLTLLSAPEALYRILPIIMVIATLSMFLAVARSSELVVARAAGRSAIRSLLAPCLVALLLGVLTVAVINPLVAATSKEYDLRSNALRGDRASILSISAQGLWLRQGTGDTQTVIRALSSNLDGTTLRDVTFVTFTQGGTPTQRIEAERATLAGTAWQIENAKVWPLSGTANPERAARFHEQLSLATDLTREGIRDSFGTPSVIPIWSLPAFIAQLERAGFSARRHLVWFHTELATPVFGLAMVLIGASFTMRHTRASRTSLRVLSAIMVAFGLYFLRNFAQILGENGQMPIWLAAWAPPLAGIGLALGLLLHLEDG
ncbi:MAG: LPS export ABC transporter permease LptG [Pseudomonadota bacterium]